MNGELVAISPYLDEVQSSDIKHQRFDIPYGSFFLYIFFSS